MALQEAALRRKTGTLQGSMRLLGLARNEVCMLLLGSVMLIVGSLAAVAVPKLAGKLLDLFFNTPRHGSLSNRSSHSVAQIIDDVRHVN